MRKSFTIRAGISVPVSLALALILSRCSPIAPTLSKLGLQPSLGARMGEPTGDRSGSSPSEFHLELTTVVMNEEALRMAVLASPPELETSAAQLSEEQLDTLSTTGRVTFHLAVTKMPNSGSAIVEVDLTSAQITSRKLNLLRFDLIHREASTWMLSIHEGVPPEMRQDLRDHLTAVAIELGDEAARPQPAPSPALAATTAQK